MLASLRDHYKAHCSSAFVYVERLCKFTKQRSQRVFNQLYNSSVRSSVRSSFLSIRESSLFVKWCRLLGSAVNWYIMSAHSACGTVVYCSSSSSSLIIGRPTAFLGLPCSLTGGVTHSSLDWDWWVLATNSNSWHNNSWVLEDWWSVLTPGLCWNHNHHL